MSWVDSLSALIATTGFPALRATPGPLIAMYHGIGGPDGVAPEAFARQLDALADRRRIVPLVEAVASLGRPESATLASVTFDDGYRDFLELALPVLSARGLQATLFVPAAQMGRWNEWDASRAPRREIVTAAELRGLDPELVGLGAHGSSHCRLRDLDDERLAEEVVGAQRVLEDATGRAVRLFAYPYGQRDDFDAAAERRVEQAGFLAACSTCFGRGSRSEERYRLRRVGIEAHDSDDVVARKFDGAYDWVGWKEALGVRWRERRRSG